MDIPHRGFHYAHGIMGETRMRRMGRGFIFSSQNQFGMLRLSGFGSQRQPTECRGLKPMDTDLSANMGNQNPSCTAAT